MLTRTVPAADGDRMSLAAAAAAVVVTRGGCGKEKNDGWGRAGFFNADLGAVIRPSIWSADADWPLVNVRGGRESLVNDGKMSLISIVRHWVPLDQMWMTGSGIHPPFSTQELANEHWDGPRWFTCSALVGMSVHDQETMAQVHAKPSRPVWETSICVLDMCT